MFVKCTYMSYMKMKLPNKAFAKRFISYTLYSYTLGYRKCIVS